MNAAFNSIFGTFRATTWRKFSLATSVATLWMVAMSGCEGDEHENSQLALAREASAKYQDVNVALADGFVKMTRCTTTPDGSMGYHYLHPVRMADQHVSVAEPDGLLYIKNPQGQLELVGIEHIVPVLVDGEIYWGCGDENHSCTPTSAQAPPSLYEGETFFGPMPGHRADMFWHYEQHVWIWSQHPAGIFAQYNPGITCKHSD